MSDDDGWNKLRAYLDAIGQESLEKAVADGIPSWVAGARIAEFNDMLIKKLKEQGQ